MPQTTAVQTKSWHSSRSKRLLALFAYPACLALNRPALSWLADLLYDMALRCSGIAITFAGTHGLTQAEENFLLRHRSRLQGGILFDIGANHGAYAQRLHELAPQARIFAFEPHPATFAFLCRRMADVPSIQVINQAVSDRSDQVTLYDFRSADGSTQASLGQAAIALYDSDIVAHAADCTTVDEFMAQTSMDHIDLLKIDTEGFDLAVLIGAATALRNRKIRMIQFEFIPADIATGVTMRRFFEVLGGYKIGRLCLNGDVRWFDRYDVKRCEIYVTHNLIAIPA
jgi:FkbM family methyltransferase